MKKLLTLVFIACCSLTAHAADTLRVLSWNVYLLPRITARYQAKRLPHIIDVLKNSHYDVLALQEVFIKPFRQQLIKDLAPVFPYHIGPTKAKGSVKVDGGQLLISRHPIQSACHTIYNDKKGIDAISDKGCILFEVQKNGKAWQFLNTHAQAYDGGGRQQVREAQYRQILSQLLQPNTKPGVPQVICGDMNTESASPQDYKRMLEILQASDSMTDPNAASWDANLNDLEQDSHPNRPTRLDYVLLKANGAPVETVSGRVVRFAKRWHPKHEDLSDHFGVEATFVRP